MLAFVMGPPPSFNTKRVLVAKTSVSVATCPSKSQRLKPDSFCESYVVAKATTHNDSQALKQTPKPAASELWFCRADGSAALTTISRPSYGSRNSARGATNLRINRIESSEGPKDPECERQAWNASKLVGYVPPLRGLMVHANSVPPLPRWAALFRPWRDWPFEGWPFTDQFSEGGPSR
jgi:hypothetical protein